MAEILAGKASGGSGGSGEVETVQVTINAAGDSSTLYGGPWNGSVFYTDKNYQYQSLTTYNEKLKTITCIKNSAVIFSGWGFDSDLEASYMIGYMEDMMNESGLYVYYFNDNITINITNIEGT